MRSRDAAIGKTWEKSAALGALLYTGRVESEAGLVDGVSRGRRDGPQERLYHALRLQGLRLSAYWLATYLYNFILYGFFASIYIGCGYLFKIEAFTRASVRHT